MCTVVILRRPDHPWPVLLGANRDEMSGRPWSPPGRHWPDRADIVAGRDNLAGGSWLGVNDSGVVAAILNRFGTLGPAEGKRSRGELVLEALDHADAVDAVDALGALNPDAWRPFNMVVADNRDAWWLRHTGAPGAAVEAIPLPEGLSMLTAFDVDDANADPRIGLHRPRFLSAPPPDPGADDWASWERLLGARDTVPTATPPARRGPETSAMTFQTASGFGTRSSSLIALPGIETPAEMRPIWRFAAGPPDQAAFAPVDLGRPG